MSAGDGGSFSNEDNLGGGGGGVNCTYTSAAAAAASSVTENSDGSTSQHHQAIKKKRSLPGNPDPNAKVIALSPTSLMAKNRFVCEICNKGFQRDQNLQLHRRGHNLPWKLKQRTSDEIIKRVYVCPEPTCVHHNPARALGDLTGIKKHFSRKHGEKKWKCDKCSKKYAVQCDWKAHSKTCGTKEYKCDCGTIFSRRDSFITHRAFCDALTEENNKVNQTTQDHHTFDDTIAGMPLNNHPSTSISTPKFSHQDTKNPSILLPKSLSLPNGSLFGSPRNISSGLHLGANGAGFHGYDNNQLGGGNSPLTSATALLQKAAQMGATSSSNCGNNNTNNGANFVMMTSMAPPSFSGMQQQQQQQLHMDTLFANQFMQNGIHQENSISRFFNNDGNNNVDDHMGMYAGFLSNGHDHTNVQGNNIEYEDSKVLMKFAAGNVNSRDDTTDTTTTVDFMGVGGMRPRNFNEHHHQGTMEI